MLTQILHQHVVTFYGLAQAQDGAWLIVTEFVSGGDLRSAVHQNGRGRPLNPREKMDIAISIAAGLWHLESKGIVHQDLKPANVLLTEQLVAKLCNFGLASLASYGNRL